MAGSASEQAASCCADFGAEPRDPDRRHGCIEGAGRARPAWTAATDPKCHGVGVARRCVGGFQRRESGLFAQYAPLARGGRRRWFSVIGPTLLVAALPQRR